MAYLVRICNEGNILANMLLRNPIRKLIKISMNNRFNRTFICNMKKKIKMIEIIEHYTINLAHVYVM